MGLEPIFGTFYKYRSLSTAEQRAFLRRAIVDRRIYFARPRELNDPFDCYPYLSLSGTAAERRGIIERIVKAQAAGARYRKRDFSAAVSRIMATMSDPTTRGEEFFSILNERTGVYCMSRKATVASQWAYYADDHRGLCLEFTVTEAMPLTVCGVKYSSTRVSLDAIEMLQRTTNLTDLLVDAITTKSDVWRSECEVRAFHRNPGEQEYPQGMLTGIVFGARTLPECVAWVQDQVAAANLTVTYSRIVPDVEHYRLNVAALV